MGEDFPEMDFRVATTRGTNALLEGKGTEPVLFVTQGFQGFADDTGPAAAGVVGAGDSEGAAYYDEGGRGVGATGGVWGSVGGAWMRRTCGGWRGNGWEKGRRLR